MLSESEKVTKMSPTPKKHKGNKGFGHGKTIDFDDFRIISGVEHTAQPFKTQGKPMISSEMVAFRD